VKGCNKELVDNVGFGTIDSLKEASIMSSNKYGQAGLKAAETKGPEERSREAHMAAWTRKHGKDDAKNP
jgi:hypothetical protein